MLATFGPLWYGRGMLRRALWGLTILMTLGSCARAPKPGVERLYEGLREYLPRLEPTILSGRKILIDPGHGGYFRGTEGPGGLEEADVNLGVALYLAGLLREAGADVHLTRSADRDFLAWEDSTVAFDLSARLAIADSLQPDVFVSIHHNAHHNGIQNAVETYYRFGDPPSRDLAFCVHRHLMRNLGIIEGEVKQGNYYLLRSINTTAILTEASYLTHPQVERKLRLAEKQRLEAEAIFLGLVEYFHRGTPTLSLISPRDSVVSSFPTIRFRATDRGGPGIDPDAVEMKVNGRIVHAVFDVDSTTISYRIPWNSPNGRYEVEAVVRNLMGNSSRTAKFSFTVSFPPREAFFNLEPRNPGGPAELRVRLVDERGFPVADGTPVLLEEPRAGRPEARVREGLVEFSIMVPEGEAELPVRIS